MRSIHESMSGLGAGLIIHVRRVAVAAFTLLPAVTPANAQSVPLRDLPNPGQEIEDPFSSITAALEFRGSQVIVVDGIEAQIHVVDFAKGTSTVLGRQGSGPGEYRIPAGVFRMRGDTLWVLDAGQMRIVTFNPDLTPGTTFPFLMFDQASTSALTAPFFADARGRMYASSMAIQASRSGSSGAMQFPDSVAVVRVDARDKSARTELTRLRFRTSGKPEMQVSGNSVKYSMAFPGLVPSDAWVVFPDGRVAILRGDSYTIEFIAPDGKKTAPNKIAYEKIKVSDEDKKAEMDEARREIAEQQKAMRKVMPTNMSFSFELTAPEKWPNEYPPVAGLAGLAAPDGSLWIKRAIPVKRGREQWDVIDKGGKLVARWQLPRKVTVAGVGAGVVYTVRTDEDDLRYLQRIALPR